jgi:uncharacterized protein
MQYRTVPKTGDRLSALGYGFMRLPQAKLGGIDEDRAIAQLRHAIDLGVNYVDTAPAYHMGRSERILGRALADGYRQKVRIATKLPPWSVSSRVDMDRILASQLATLKVGLIDYYLIHSLTRSSWEKMVRLGVLDFLGSAKADGRIQNAGFSFHGDIGTFREIVDSYSWEFCQIQYNYLDENNQAGTEGLLYAGSKQLAVMVMEPLRGGNLAGKIPGPVMEVWDESPVKRSPAEWALRWVWDHPEVTVVLSGMNDEAHIDENIRVASEAFPNTLKPDERDLVSRVRDTYARLMRVSCTGCGYCMPCPAGVDIPDCFALYNAHHLFPGDPAPWFQYISRHGGLLSSQSHAGLCTKCGRCERICPQHIHVRRRMSDVSKEMDRLMGPVVVVLKGGLWCMNQIGRVKRLVLRGRSF